MKKSKLRSSIGLVRIQTTLVGAEGRIVATEPIIARHETFHPRFNWLKKGFDEASGNPEAFIDENAHVNLGVGKNMVRSMRYWCHAFKLLEDDPESKGRRKPSRPTCFGRDLLEADGWDPFLEDKGSLWLLHWELLKEPCFATAWHYAFFVHPRLELSSDELTFGLRVFLERQNPGARKAVSSLKKDALCILRMYGEAPSGGSISEETIQCPFAELGLIRTGLDSKTYCFRVGPKPGLSSRLITSAALDFAASQSGGSKTISIARLLRAPGSPGLAFKLTEAALYGALEEVVNERADLDLQNTAGIVQLVFHESPDILTKDLIRSHYASLRGLEAVA